MILLKNVDLYSPKYKGKNDILCTKTVEYINNKISLEKSNIPSLEVIDCEGLIAIPGLIDLHVHMIGGGGEGGFVTRTPEMNLTKFSSNGVTTIVGLLGTDGVTRNMSSLLAKARALEEEGLTTYIWTGCYEVPTRTITSSSREDIVLIDKIIGIGEIAVSDHRGSHPSLTQLQYLASESRVGGMLSSKCGILHIHMGDGKKGLGPVLELLEKTDIPYENILPTHINRNEKLFEECIGFCKNGGFVDITTGIFKTVDDGVEVNPEDAFKVMLDEGIDPMHITMSSDSGGSMPIFNDDGKLISIGVGTPSTNLETIKNMIKLNIPLETALIPLTVSPAKLLKLKGKGEINEGSDCDIVLLDKEFKVHSVISKGKFLVSNYNVVVKGMFEE